MKQVGTDRNKARKPMPAGLCLLGLLGSLVCFGAVRMARGQSADRGDEIVANLAGGRVIVHVAHEKVIFAAIDQPVEANSIPPRVLSLDGKHIGILMGASEWRHTSDPKPVRLDKDFPRLGGRNQHYAVDSEEVAPDLDVVGVAFLERLRPLVTQLHHKIEFKPDEALFELVMIGYAPEDYGPEVWTVEYRIQQEEIATRGDFWQTRLLRPRFTQLYPPEKHAPKKLVEVRYPDTLPGPTLQQLIEGNDPDIEKLAHRDPKLLKVWESIEKGQANKAPDEDAASFMQAVMPLVVDKAHFILGTMSEHGFEWILAPDEPVEKAKEDKKQPPDAPTLHPRIKPQ